MQHVKRAVPKSVHPAILVLRLLPAKGWVAYGRRVVRGAHTNYFHF